VNLGQLRRCALHHPVFLISGEVVLSVGANVGQPVPLVHAKLPHADFDVEPVVVLWIDAPARQVLFLHLFVDLFAPLDLRNQLAPSLSKFAQEAFIPQRRVRVTAPWSLARAEADEDANFTARPLIYHSLVQSNHGGIEVPCTVIVKHGLANLDWLKRKTDSACCSASLPDLAVKFRSRLTSRIIGAQ